MDSDMYAEKLRIVHDRLGKGFELHKKDRELIVEALIHVLERIDKQKWK